jgi:hypothetical protein
MRRTLALTLCTVALAACGRSGPAQNPDPNHTHADFAVFLGGNRADFAEEIYMSGSSKEGEDHSADHHQFFHLHDGNGTVIHRHKPALTLGEFFSSLPGVRYRGDEFLFMDCLGCANAQGSWRVRLFVNGEERTEGSEYPFSDLDKIVLTDTTDPAELRSQLRSVSDDACLYSRTCPERGDPPTENCIADPTVPCTL